jgi:hypothetical protein
MAFRKVMLAAALLVPFGVVSPASASISPYVETVAALGPCDEYVALYNYGQGTWTEVGGQASAIYMGAPGLFATDPKTGDISRYNGTPGSWTTIGGPGAQFAVGGSYLYGLGPSMNYVAVWNGVGQGWSVIGGAANAIAAGGAGLVATNPASTAVDRYNGTPGSWTQIGGSAIASGSVFTVGDSGIYAVTSGGVVEQWAGGQSWTVIGSGARQLYAGGAGVYAISSANGDIEQYSGTPGGWTVIGGPGDQFAVSQTALYGLATDYTYVAQYTPGVGWNEIGGETDGITAGG